LKGNKKRVDHGLLKEGYGTVSSFRINRSEANV